MRKRVVCALLALLLAAPLCACGRAKAAPETAAPAADAERASEIPAAFPLLSAPFTEEESEAMANHNAARFALLDTDRYFTREYFDDGSCALVRYTIVDAVPRDRTVLAPDCAADYLALLDGRLYFLGDGGRVESMKADGAERRTELDRPCRSLQVFGGALICLGADGTLLSLRGGEEETLLSGCAWAFVSAEGVFYTALSDGRAHLYRPEARTDTALTDAAAESPTVIGRMLYYLAREGDGAYLCALDLFDGESLRLDEPVLPPAEFLPLDGEWSVRLRFVPDGARQMTAPCGALFSSAAFVPAGGAERMRCRSLDADLRTEELLSPDGAPLGTALILPDGRSYPFYAADNPRD